MLSKESEDTVKKTLVVLAVNDLESVEIYNLLKNAGIPMLAYDCPWGEKIIYAKDKIKDKYKLGSIAKILLVERRQKEDISVLKELYPDATIQYLDHHSYSDEPTLEQKEKDKGKDENKNDNSLFQKSALEQIFDALPKLKKYKNDKTFEKNIANDKDFIPGLAEVILEQKTFIENEKLVKVLWTSLDNSIELKQKNGKFNTIELLENIFPDTNELIQSFKKSFEKSNYDDVINQITSFRRNEILIQYAFCDEIEKKELQDSKETIPFAVYICNKYSKKPYLSFEEKKKETKCYIKQAEMQRNIRHFTTGRIRDNGAPELTLVRYPEQYAFCMSDELYIYEKERKKEQFLTFCLSDFYEIDNDRRDEQGKIYYRKKSLRRVCDDVEERIKSFYANYSPYIGIVYKGKCENHTDNSVYDDAHIGFIYSGKTANNVKKNKLRKKSDEICNNVRDMCSYAGKNYYSIGFNNTDSAFRDDAKKAINKILDYHLNELLIDNRPLVAWRTSFFQPMAYSESKKHPNIKNADKTFHPYEARDQEHAFFLSYLRKLITPKAKDLDSINQDDHLGENFIASYEYNAFELGKNNLSARLMYPNLQGNLNIPLSRILVHFFNNETLVLEWQVEQTTKKPIGNNDSLSLEAYWKKLLFGAYEESNLGKMLTPAQVIDVNEKLRFAYSTFKTNNLFDCFNLSLCKDGKEVGDNLHFGQQVHITDIDRQMDEYDDFYGFFRALASHVLKAFDFDIAEHQKDQEKTENPITFLGDDRARVVSSMVFSGDVPDNIVYGDESWKFCDPDLDILFSRFRVVDSYGREYFSDSEFEKTDREGHIYNRYKNMGSLYGITDHSFVFMGFGEYSQEHIHEKHMKTMYSRMFLVALFYVSILHKFSKDISLKARKGHNFLDLRKELNVFTNGFWYEQITSQVQGKELFSMMRSTSTMEKDYELVHNEIERMDELEAARSSRLNERFERVIALAAIIGLTYASLRLWWSVETTPTYLETLKIYIMQKIMSGPLCLYSLVDVLVIWLAAVVLLYSSGFQDKLKQERLENGKKHSGITIIWDCIRSPCVWLYRIFTK